MASTTISTVTHETVTLADLLQSQGTGAVEIPSIAGQDDPANTTITHVLDGGYNANLILVTSTVRADVANGNYFSDARIGITPAGGTIFGVFGAAGGEAIQPGDTFSFEDNASSVFADPKPGGGQLIQPGAATFQFFEGFDEAAGVDNTYIDLTIDFVEVEAGDGEFDLGTLTSGLAYLNGQHSHAPGGRDFFTFTVPSDGVLDVLTDVSNAGSFGFSLFDTEIGLFDSEGGLVAQHNDIDATNFNFFSEFSSLEIEAGDYTLVTTTWNSSLTDSLDVGSNISEVTGGSGFGDYEMTLLFTANDALTCDFDINGTCDNADLILLYDNFGTVNAVADLDGDGTVGESDIAVWLEAASSPDNAFNVEEHTFVLGDVNLDGRVNSTDLGLVLNSFGSAERQEYGGGNLNGDDVVNSTDLGLVLNNFNFESAFTNTVPEPGGMAWLLACIVLFCRRRRTKSI